MKYFTRITSAVLLIAVALAPASTLFGQQREYRELTLQDQRPSLFFDFIVLPGDTDDSITFASVYSFSYQYLPFKKTDGSQPDKAFFSPLNLNMEVFKADKEQLKKKGDVSVKGLEPVERASSEDTAYAKTYEQSQSRLAFLQGNVKVNLKPGIYSYVLQLTRGEKSDPRMSKTRTVSIESYRDMKMGNILLGSNLSPNKNSPDLFKLMSMGNNVKYGDDFYALAYIPNYEAENNYSVTVSALKASRGDTSQTNQVYSQDISEEDIKTDLKPTIPSTSSKENILQLSSSANGFAYALVKIPNSTFPNDLYKLTVKEKGSDKVVSETTFQSMWIDMPRSLLSLDFATRMLYYIVDEATINRLSSGSKAERERKFRSFWKEKDPTPDTEFNEIMAEYYRRIDYAYQNYSTSNKAGFESDQGKVYITYGPPKNIERKFPTNGSTVEIWTYPDKKFVFEATSGFGDFKLISK